MTSLKEKREVTQRIEAHVPGLFFSMEYERENILYLTSVKAPSQELIGEIRTLALPYIVIFRINEIPEGWKLVKKQ